MIIVKLNDTQKRELEEFSKHYKYFYICNKCGSVYGTDAREAKEIICHVCELEEERKKRKEKNA